MSNHIFKRKSRRRADLSAIAPLLERDVEAGSVPANARG
jgi:hypothetical protein